MNIYWKEKQYKKWLLISIVIYMFRTLYEMLENISIKNKHHSLQGSVILQISVV